MSIVLLHCSRCLLLHFMFHALVAFSSCFGHVACFACRPFAMLYLIGDVPICARDSATGNGSAGLVRISLQFGCGIQLEFWQDPLQIFRPPQSNTYPTRKSTTIQCNPTRNMIGSPGIEQSTEWSSVLKFEMSILQALGHKWATQSSSKPNDTSFNSEIFSYTTHS